MKEVIEQFQTEYFLRLNLTSYPFSLNRRDYIVTCLIDVRLFGADDTGEPFLSYHILNFKVRTDQVRKTWVTQTLEKYALQKEIFSDDDFLLRPIATKLRELVKEKILASINSQIAKNQEEVDSIFD